MMMFLGLMFGIGVIVAPIIVGIKTKGQKRRGLKVLASSIACFILLVVCAIADTPTQPTQPAQTAQVQQEEQEQQEAQRQVAINLMRYVYIFLKQEEEVLSKGDIVTLYDFYKNWEENWLYLDTKGWNEDLESVRLWARAYCEKAQKYLENPNNVKIASDLKEKRGYFDNAWCNVMYNYTITLEELGISE